MSDGPISVDNLRQDLTVWTYNKDDDNSFNWILSYADLVTLLLCFFIMFFAIYSKRRIDEIKQEAKTALAKEMKESAQAKTAALVDKKLAEKFANLDKVFSLVHPISGIETYKKRDHFLIVFNDGNFFDPGSTQLNLIGQYRISVVLERLLNVSQYIYLDIQGHTDGTPVGNKNKGYKNNIELSLRRASSVYEFFHSYGFPEEAMSISGHAHNRPIIFESDEEERLLARNRRVTFRIEPR
jgi:chemotaxis protein MotB